MVLSAVFSCFHVSDRILWIVRLSIWCDILRKPFLLFWYKCSLWLKDEMIRIWWTKVKGQGHCNLAKHIFGHNSHLYGNTFQRLIGQSDEVMKFDVQEVRTWMQHHSSETATWLVCRGRQPHYNYLCYEILLKHLSALEFALSSKLI